jgi:hypothetical protein
MEIRKNACVNTVTRGGECDCSFQDFAGEERGIQGKKKISNLLFSVDMSDARENSVSNLKEWFDGYLGKQEYVPRYNEIFDPIGDAEVVCNFSAETKWGFRNIQCNEVERVEFGFEDFCVLLYGYSKKLKEKLGKKQDFDDFIVTSIKTIKNSIYSSFYNNVIQKVNNRSVNWIENMLEKEIDWELEKQYMQRQKSEKDNGEKVPIDVYKEDNQEPITGLWKQICIEAVKGKYSCVNCSNL